MVNWTVTRSQRDKKINNLNKIKNMIRIKIKHNLSLTLAQKRHKNKLMKKISRKEDGPQMNIKSFLMQSKSMAKIGIKLQITLVPETQSMQDLTLKNSSRNLRLN
jgi:hypothetical protein